MIKMIEQKKSFYEIVSNWFFSFEISKMFWLLDIILNRNFQTVEPPTLEQRKNIKLESRERSSEFRKLYEITGVVGVGGGGTVYAGNVLTLTLSEELRMLI